MYTLMSCVEVPFAGCMATCQYHSLIGLAPKSAAYASSTSGAMRLTPNNFAVPMYAFCFILPVFVDIKFLRKYGCIAAVSMFVIAVASCEGPIMHSVVAVAVLVELMFMYVTVSLLPKHKYRE